MRWQCDYEVFTEWAGESLFSGNEASWKQEEREGKERRPEPQHSKRKQSWGKELHESVEPTSWVEMKTERSHRSAILPSACGPIARMVLAHWQSSFCLSYQQDLDDKNHHLIEHLSMANRLNKKLTPWSESREKSTFVKPSCENTHQGIPFCYVLVTRLWAAGCMGTPWSPGCRLLLSCPSLSDYKHLNSEWGRCSPLPGHFVFKCSYQYKNQEHQDHPWKTLYGSLLSVY